MERSSFSSSLRESKQVGRCVAGENSKMAIGMFSNVEDDASESQEQREDEREDAVRVLAPSEDRYAKEGNDVGVLEGGGGSSLLPQGLPLLFEWILPLR